MCLRIMQKLIAVLAGVFLVSSGVYAADVSDVIAQNIKDTTILDVKIQTIPNDDSLMLIVKTSAGERRFIVTKENIVAALAVLQNPERYGATNALLLNRTIAHLPSATPLILAKNPPKSPPQPVTTTTATAAAAPVPQIVQNAIDTSSTAPAIVSSMVLSANQQASK